MKKNNKNDKNNIKIINNGANISNSIKKINEKESKRKIIFIYIIPLSVLVILGFTYIFTQINILLIPFAILMFIVLFGWDGATRVCPNCKKWNSVIWIKKESITEIEENTKNTSNSEKKRHKENKKQIKKNGDKLYN